MKIRGLIGGTATAALLAYVTGPLWAQDSGDGGLRYSFGFQQGFGYGDNLALGVPGSTTNPEEGTTALSTTEFAFQVESVTPIEEFRFQIGGALRFGSIPDGSNTDTGFVDPFFGLDYVRNGQSSRFSFATEFRESDISLSRPLWDFSDEDNVIVPPSDLANLQGTGQRRELISRVDLELGRDAPLGFVFRADANRVEYENATDQDLTDFERFGVSMSTIYRLDKATALVLDLRATRFSEDDGSPDRDTYTAEVGFDRELANASQVSARIGYTNSDEDGVDTTDTSSGITGSLNYGGQLTNGRYDARYSLSRSNDGDLSTLAFVRQYDLPLGNFSFEIGASSLDGASPEPIGGINLFRETRNGRYSIQLDRRVQFDSDDEERFTTTLAAQYRQNLTPYSAFLADFSYFLADGTTSSNEVERTNLRLTYEYALTDDWNLNSGLSWRVRDEDNVGKGESEALFVNLTRRFDLF